jgi:hypothetical protein
VEDWKASIYRLGLFKGDLEHDLIGSKCSTWEIEAACHWLEILRSQFRPARGNPW